VLGNVPDALIQEGTPLMISTAHRRRAHLCLILVLTLGASACSGATDESTATAPTDTTTGTTATGGETTTSQPVPTTDAAPVDSTGGTLGIAIGTDPGHLNPAITTSGATHTASELLYNGLVDVNDEGLPVPSLAERWDISEEGAVYTFHLADGVFWHDGEPFTSADVKFAFEEVILQFHSRSAASIGNAIESIETPDDRTVVFRFSQPYAPLLYQLNVTEAPIVARHIYEGSDPTENPANLTPVGTGPFQFVSYTPDSEIRFARNDNYFKEGLPYLDEVVMRVIPEPANQVIALERGEVDWIWGVPGPDRNRLESDPSYGFLSTGNNPGGANCIMTVSFNLERPLFAEVEFRRALAMAIDRQPFLDNILFGQGQVASAPIHSGIPFAHGQGLAMPAYDPDGARALLETLGWVDDGSGTRVAQGVEGIADGAPLSFDFVHFPAFSAYGELLRAQLAEIGVEVELRPFDPPVFAPTVFEERDFDTNIISYCNGTDPEIGVKRMYVSSDIRPIPFSNSSAYSNEDVDRLFAQAALTIDSEERRPIYQEIQEILVEELPYFWIVETTSLRAHTSKCTGFTAAGHFAEMVQCSR
jgi:peptide/nickel transport system substrate-binding protein